MYQQLTWLIKINPSLKEEIQRKSLSGHGHPGQP